MSFSFNFTAKDKRSALEQVGKAYAPGSIKAFLETAINSLKDDPIIDVKANGHLNETPGHFEVSTATIVVPPIRPL